MLAAIRLAAAHKTAAHSVKSNSRRGINPVLTENLQRYAERYLFLSAMCGAHVLRLTIRSTNVRNFMRCGSLPRGGLARTSAARRQMAHRMTDPLMGYVAFISHHPKERTQAARRIMSEPDAAGGPDANLALGASFCSADAHSSICTRVREIALRLPPGSFL